MVAEEWQYADEEHGCHKEKEEYVEFCMGIWQFIFSDIALYEQLPGQLILELRRAATA